MLPEEVWFIKEVDWLIKLNKEEVFVISSQDSQEFPIVCIDTEVILGRYIDTEAVFFLPIFHLPKKFFLGDISTVKLSEVNSFSIWRLQMKSTE